MFVALCCILLAFDVKCWCLMDKVCFDNYCWYVKVVGKCDV